MSVNTNPDTYYTITPYLTVQGADHLLAFLKRAFGGQERRRMMRPDGAIAHAEIAIGAALIMLADAEAGSEPLPCAVHLHVDDLDGTYRRALSAGASVVAEPADEPYGERKAGVMDGCGNTWWLVTDRMDGRPAEMQRRMVVEMIWQGAKP